MKIFLPYGKGGMEVGLPAENCFVLSPPSSTDDGPVDSGATVWQAGFPLLKSISPERKKALVTITDHHRFGFYQKAILRRVLADLQSASAVQILVARGTHSTLKPGEYGDYYGVGPEFDLIIHDPHCAEDLVDLGRSPGGDPILVNRRILEADLVIGIGLIQPSGRAGYNGGAKLFAVGCAGFPTIMSTHSTSLYFHPQSRVGNFQDHPFRARLLAIARHAERQSRAGKFFVINAVEQRQCTLSVFSGDMEEAWQLGCRFFQKRFEAWAPAPADIVVCGGGAPTDSTPYAFTSILNVLVRSNPVPLVKEGGVIIALASLERRPAPGSMDDKFLSWVEKMPYSQAARIAEAMDGPEAAGRDLEGLHKFLSVAALFNHVRGNIFIVGAKERESVSRLGFAYFERFHQALDLALEKRGAGSSILVIPDLKAVLPFVGNR